MDTWVIIMNFLKLTKSEKTIIAWHKAGMMVYEIELQTNKSQEFIEKVLYMHERLQESNIDMG